MKPLLSFLLLLLMFSSVHSGQSQTSANLIAQFTFENSSLSDATGNFGSLSLFNSATISEGRLVLQAGQWARAVDYTGPNISEKTLVTWVAVENINSTGGSALTLDKISVDNFDGIVFGEMSSQPQSFISGSSNWDRTEAFVPGYAETGCEMVQWAVVYQNNGSGLSLITAYRNGVLMGFYTKGVMPTWAAGDTELILGARHTYDGFYIGANLVGQIEEVRIYNAALTQDQITTLNTEVTSQYNATTWYIDTDGDGLGDAASSQSACDQPAGYVADSSDLCDDNTSCNYNDVANTACTYATDWYADTDGDGLGDAASSQSACDQPAGYVADSSDLCDDNTAENYAAAENPPCSYPANGLSATILVCTGSDVVSLDLDTIHEYAGVNEYAILENFSGEYATLSQVANLVTFDFSGSGVGQDTLKFAAAVGAANYQLKIFVEEALYPQHIGPIQALAATSAGGEDGAIQLNLEGTYDAPVVLHFLAYEDQNLINGLTQIPNDTYILTGLTNVKGCYNPMPATSATPSTASQALKVLVPSIQCPQTP